LFQWAAVENTLANIHDLARRFAIPAGWFREEAEAGRLPCLKAGGCYLFNVRAVEQALAERAAAREREVCGNA
jgi:hypothetical protein